MKIAIDARWIFREISGIGAYTRELIRHLAILDKANQYLLIFSDPELLKRTVEETKIATVSAMTPVLVPYGVFSLKGQLALPGFLRQQNVDIFHSTNFMIPLLTFPRRQGRMRCVVTIHDVIPLVFPHHAPRSKKSRLFPVYKALMREIGIRATRVVTDSEASKQDIIRLLPMDASRADSVRVIYCGVGSHYRPETKGSASPDQAKTILYVGRADPYKNIATLIRAFAIVRAAVSAPVRLRIVGADDPRYPETKELARSLQVSDYIDWTGYLSDTDMVKAYQQADVLMHPSRYEGFGLQIVEAMACGLPVVCSRGGSLPEVAGEAAITHDADDVAGFAQSLQRVLTDPVLANSMTEKGYANVTRFSWEKTAKATLAVYHELAVPKSGVNPS